MPDLGQSVRPAIDRKQAIEAGCEACDRWTRKFGARPSLREAVSLTVDVLSRQPNQPLKAVDLSDEELRELSAILYVASIETECNRQTKRDMMRFRERINAALEGDDA